MSLSLRTMMSLSLITSIIPTTLVLMWVFSSSFSLANPKSDILGLRSLIPIKEYI